MLIYTETWTRESHGLYDFDNDEIQSCKFRINGSFIISRKESTVFCTPLENESQTFQENENQ